MTGRQLADQLTRQHTEVTCIFMSGYPSDAIELDGHLPDGVQFLQKPFTPEQLARAIREALAESG
jgi:FixJ family two-component response regulator